MCEHAQVGPVVLFYTITQEPHFLPSCSSAIPKYIATSLFLLQLKDREIKYGKQAFNVLRPKSVSGPCPAHDAENLATEGNQPQGGGGIMRLIAEQSCAQQGSMDTCCGSREEGIWVATDCPRLSEILFFIIQTNIPK